LEAAWALTNIPASASKRALCLCLSSCSTRFPTSLLRLTRVYVTCMCNVRSLSRSLPHTAPSHHKRTLLSLLHLPLRDARPRRGRTQARVRTAAGSVDGGTASTGQWGCTAGGAHTDGNNR
jgi:hypothetical protein